jgi:hypothetical protein
VAPTILKSLGLNPAALDAVRAEGIEKSILLLYTVS